MMTLVEEYTDYTKSTFVQVLQYIYFNNPG